MGEKFTGKKQNQMTQRYYAVYYNKYFLKVHQKYDSNLFNIL